MLCERYWNDCELADFWTTTDGSGTLSGTVLIFCPLVEIPGRITYDDGPMAQSARVPTVKAMLACQRVLKEEGTGLVSVIGIFQTITAKSLPLTLPSVFVFASLTDAQGEYLFRLEIVRQSDEKKIAEVTLPSVSVEDPMANGEMTVELNGLTFDEAGAYEFRLWANDRFLANTAMAIALVQSREEGDHESRED